MKRVEKEGEIDGWEFSWHALIGQGKAKKLLLRAVANGKTPHGLFFRGPVGVGKKKAAATFAAYLNCLDPHDGDSCGRCTACRKFQSGNHPDYHVIAPQGASIKIDQIRGLKNILPYKPYEGRYRVIVVTEAHTMRREAANSLLKTLEEPPADTVLILTADETGAILPTILSRCQLISFQPLTLDEAAAFFVRHSKLATGEARVLAALGGGSIGRGKFFLEKGILTLRKNILERLFVLDRRTADGVEEVYDLAEQAVKLKENLPELFDLLQIWLRDLILVQNGEEDRIANVDMLPLLNEAARRWPGPDDIFAKLALIDAARRQYQRNCNRNLICEVLFFELMSTTC